MSLTVVVGSRDGVAISTDSRGAAQIFPGAGPTALERGLISTADGFEKLAVYREKYVVAWLGTGRGGTSPTTVLQELREDGALQAARTSAEFLNAIADAARGIEAKPIVAWVDNDTSTHMGWLDLASGEFTDYHAGVWPVGFGEERINGLLIEPSVGQSVIPDGLLSIEAAANLSRFLVQTVIDLQSFELHGRPVGGQVQTAIAPVSGPARLVVPREVHVREFGSGATAIAIPPTGRSLADRGGGINFARG